MAGKPNNTKFWDIDRTASYNCLFNFILGIRGAGKTYGLLKYLIEKNMRTGNRFLYVRRTDEELKKLTITKNARIFNLVQKEFPDNALWAESNVLHMDDRIIGYAQSLGAAGKTKSDALENVRDIVFDEFIINTAITRSRYLQDEVTAFLELYESVARPGARDYDVRCWFLGNAVSSSNPYFDKMDLHIPYKTDIWRRGDFLVQMVAPQELIEAKKQTRFYQAIEGTEYAQYAAENKFLTDNTHFIAKKSKDSEYQFTLVYYEDEIGVWRSYRNGCYFISDDIDKQCRTVYACTTETQQPNVLLLKGFKSSTNLSNLKKAYDMGCVYYENQRLSNWFRDIVRMGM